MYIGVLESLWSVVMMEMTVDDLKNPEQEVVLCMPPCVFKKKFFHWIFLLVGVMIQGGVPLSFLVGILWGYISFRGWLNWSILSPSAG
jgi:hypothetical protein